MVGDNGAGKTSVLEAVGYLSRLSSFRGAPDSALVGIGTSQAVIRGGVERESGEFRVEIEISEDGRRRALINGKRPRRNADVALEIPMVAFLPDDLELVKRGPSLRRDYLDELASNLSAANGALQANYEKVVRQRNRLLRDHGRYTDLATLDVWDEKLAELGGRLTASRLELLDGLATHLRAGYSAVASRSVETLTARYNAWWLDGDPVEALRRAISQRRNRDLDQRTSSVGPHRDDVDFSLGSRPARTHASQGEQRSVALALRITAFSLLEERHGRPPILLLDDVFSELDSDRSRGVIALLPRGQVFVTSSRDDVVPVAGRRWRIEEGAIREVEL